MVLLTVGGWLWFDYEKVDAFSSGRFSKFQEAIQASLEDAPVSDWLFGSSFQQTYEVNPRFVRAYHEAVHDDRYRRAHIENLYVQIFLSHGLLGLVTFVLPFVFVYVQLHKALKSVTDLRRLNVIVAIASLNGLFFNSLVASNIPSFGNVLAIFLPVIWLPPMYFKNR
jgi:O-antigen ligase